MYEFGVEKCIGNIKGGKGDSGQDFKILDFFETVQALSEAIPNPSVGDAYGIGSEAPYDIYIYSQSHGWVNSGTLQPDINEQAPSYDESTTLENLTSGEKMSLAFGKIAKAIRDFISHLTDGVKHIKSDERTTWNSKAPGGHGLGESAKGFTDTPLKDLLKQGGGFYQVDNAEDTPYENKDWVGLIQAPRSVADDTLAGVQMVFQDWYINNPQMWLRTVLRGDAGDWVEMLHSGNIADYRHKIVTGSYTGDSALSRKISLEFTPDIVLVFGKSGMVSFLTPENGYRGCGGMAFKDNPCKVGDTSTIEIVDGGFEVSYIAPNGDSTVNVPMSNESNAQYYYMAIRKPIK